MLKLYNSLTRKVEDFRALRPPHVGIYTCGPTVYNFAHIGNFRAYMTADLLVRTLTYLDFVVEFVMNITDVGHLTSDADTGEDKLEKSAKKEGKTAWEVAEFYTDVFLQDYEKLGLTPVSILAKATDHIQEQIALIERLEEKGYTYITSDGVYFDTNKFPAYGQLSTLDQIKEGARVEVNTEKRNPRDFALWKFSPTDEKRQMEWESPWGVGFPGWHIECSAMSMKYLGNHFDIHTGGIDHLSIHHPDEIAQSEAATGEKFANYWVHTAFMQVAGQKMSKSLGNIYRLYDLEKEGYDPMSLRYLYLQTHYRQEMNFTFAALDAAQNALKKLRLEIATWEIASQADEDEQSVAEVGAFEKRFMEAISDDLNTPKTLAVLWELVKSPVSPKAKAAGVFRMDSVLGLRLQEGSMEVARQEQMVPKEVKALVKEREHFRKNRQFSLADNVRAKIEKLGYMVEDSKTGPKIRKRS
jgi:cysteinyl-tRNA synthetase